MKSKKDGVKFLYTFMGVCLAIFILWFWYVYATNVWVKHRYVLEVKPYNAITLNYTLDNPYESTAEIKTDLDKLFNAGAYIYKEEQLRPGVGATTNLTFRIITISPRYVNNPHYYTFFLAHELTHLKYYTGNECFTEYKAIITLYESGNEYFKNVALCQANATMLNNLQDEYDCGYYLVEYFKNNK